MNKRTAFFLLAIVVLLAIAQEFVLWNQRQELKKLTEKLNSIGTKAPDLDSQEKCAKQALEQFKLQGFKTEGDLLKTGDASYFTSHFNKSMNRCFMELHHETFKNNDLYETISILDAFEGKDYATYNRSSRKDPFYCDMTLPNGEEKNCKSSDEFDALVKQYMD